MVSYETVKYAEDEDVNVLDMDGDIVIPVLWMYWQYVMSNLTIDKQVLTGEREGKLSDIVVRELLADFSMYRRIRKNGYDIPLLLGYDTQRKFWYGCDSVMSDCKFVDLRLKGQTRVVMNCHGEYYSDDDFNVYTNNALEDELIVNRQIVKYFGKKLLFNVRDFAPVNHRLM